MGGISWPGILMPRFRWDSALHPKYVATIG
jgi:hypothetical protein